MKTLACVSAVVLLSLLAGCNNNKRVTYKSVTSDLTPELKGMATRPADAHNAFAVTANQNLRMLSDDLARMFHTDHPSRLSPFPVVYTSGQPR